MTMRRSVAETGPLGISKNDAPAIEPKIRVSPENADKFSTRHSSVENKEQQP